MTMEKLSGSEALARGALEAGVQFATGYPGSPATSVIDALLRLASREVRIEWAINEKSAFDAAFGASLARVRSLLCLKSVGLNVALDSLMVSNLAAGEGGFVILVGDDPGGWGSQNEEDSRPLVAAAEVPLLEPVSVSEARSVMRQAFGLSEELRVPVAVRTTRALSVGRTNPTPSQAPPALGRGPVFRRQPERLNVLPIHVLDFHRRLQATLVVARDRFESSALNGVEGGGPAGIITSGYAYGKLKEAVGLGGDQSGFKDHLPGARILRLSTLHPLPSGLIVRFLQRVDRVLVLEETAPYVETQVQAVAQRAGLTLPIYGRHSGHLPGAGELFGREITRALSAILPGWEEQAPGPTGRNMPSRRPLCEDCPYIPALEALLAVIERHGGRDAFVITGETGCMVRAQLPPWEIMDLKYGMGSSIGLAAGLARTAIPQGIIALSGDSALLHSGSGELIDAVQAGVDLLVVVLANGTTALSGGQPHPGTAHDVLGRSRRAVDLTALIHAMGVDLVRVVDPLDRRATEAAYEEGLDAAGVSVVIVERACPLWAGEPVR
jgi:indolepyruvate ferredoxin oxidoreductase alpha subunit